MEDCTSDTSPWFVYFVQNIRSKRQQTMKQLMDGIYEMNNNK